MYAEPIHLTDVFRDVNQKRFLSNSPEYLSGRCLIDLLEFLRIGPRWSARFNVLINAHAMRLSWCCLMELWPKDAEALSSHSGSNEQGENHLVRFCADLIRTAEFVLKSRNKDLPAFGDDFWDWAYILDGLATIGKSGIDGTDHIKEVLAAEFTQFFVACEKGIASDLALGRSGEWFGPANAVAAHRLLIRYRELIQGIDEGKIDECLGALKRLALEPIVGDEYRGRKVQPQYYEWHLGQVVAEFPTESEQALSQIKSTIRERLTEPDERCYAFTRMYQAAIAVESIDLTETCLNALYDCQSEDRPLSTGIVAGRIKGSANCLEAVWPSVTDTGREEIRQMVKALIAARRKQTVFGIFTALPFEEQECCKAFQEDGATINKNGEVVHIDHPEYRAVVTIGKALLDSQHAANRLLERYRVSAVLTVGIAGSLGNPVNEQISPSKGDVVLATCTASYGVREKARAIKVNAPVPFGEFMLSVIPCDPELFIAAEQVVEGREDVHRGYIVTHNGILDAPEEKASVLKEWPDGKAVAEEGFSVALQCANHSVPHLEIRGISDLAQGDKGAQKRDEEEEAFQQGRAAKKAAEIAVKVVKVMSGRAWR